MLLRNFVFEGEGGYWTFVSSHKEVKKLQGVLEKVLEKIESSAIVSSFMYIVMREKYGVVPSVATALKSKTIGVDEPNCK